MKENTVSDSIHEAIIAYFENKLSQKQAEELIEWVGENSENLHYFKEIRNIWYASGLLKKESPDTSKVFNRLIDKIEENDFRPIPGRSVHIYLSTLTKIASAAVIFIIIGIGSLIMFRKPSENQPDKYFEASAPKGSKSIITLSDGSKVWLNSGTKVRYNVDFGIKSRDINLEGEAYFSVAENKDIPFKVKTSDVCITALGTAFNVKAYNDENIVETTLEKGKVLIESVGAGKSEISQSSVYLKPNQKAVFVRSSRSLSINDTKTAPVNAGKTPEVKIKPVQIKVDSLVDTRLTTSWKDSKWIFKSEKLSKLVPILERRYDITVSFVDTVLYNYRFTGTLKEESLEQVLKALSLAAPIRFEVAHNQVFLYEDQVKMYKYFRQIKQQNK